MKLLNIAQYNTPSGFSSEHNIIHSSLSSDAFTYLDNLVHIWILEDFSISNHLVLSFTDFTLAILYFIAPAILLWSFRRSLKENKWPFLAFLAFYILFGIEHFHHSSLGNLSFTLAFILLICLVAILYFAFTHLGKSLRWVEKQRLKQELKSKEVLELFFKNSPGAIAMFDLEMNYLATNDNFLKFFHFKKDSLIGSNHYDSFPNNEKMEEFKNYHKKALKGETIKKDHEIYNLNGKEIHARWTLEPWFTNDKKIGGIILFTEFINVQVALTNKLIATSKKAKRQEQIVDEMSEIARAGTWSLDLLDNTIEWSDAVYDIHELERGTKIELKDGISFYHPDHRETITQAINNAIYSQQVWDLELKFVTAKNKHIWVRSIGKPVIRKGKVVALHGLFQDIDKQKKSEEAILNANKHLEANVKERTHELEAFTYSVSHDLRAPIRAINGFSMALKENFTNNLPESAQHYLSRIISNSQKMGQLIDDLLMFSRMNKLEQKLSTIDLNQIITNLVNELFDNSKEFITIEKLPTAIGDSVMIKQVFQNLLSNAIKYSSNEKIPQIEIKGWVHKNESIICISDNGVGFDSRHSDKLFGIFQRLHRDEEFPGTGVGLALCHKIINRHHGKIWAESQLGIGSKFYISIKHSNSKWKG